MRSTASSDRVSFRSPAATTVRLPNFLIIGAAKSGTTSLASYLAQHPEVFFSPWKEPNYFALAGRKLPPPGPVPPDVMYRLLYFHSVTTLPDYERLFAGAGDQPAVGEASVRYLYSPEAPARIHELLPGVRMIAVLRDPVSRLFSHYCMNLQHQLEPLELRDALAQEENRRAAGWGWDWHYVNVGRYAAQVRRYFERFGREQVKVILYDDFVARPLEVFRDVCRHIGIADTFTPDMSERGKVAHRPRSLRLDRWLHWPSPTRRCIERAFPRRLWRPAFARLGRWNSLPPPKLDAGLRAELSSLFRDDIAELEDLLGRSIPWAR